MPYHDLASVAQRKMPLLPAYLLLLDRFNPAEYLKDYRGPVKIVLAGADESFLRNPGADYLRDIKGRKTCKSSPAPATTTLPDNRLEWWKEVFRFWQQNRPPPPPPETTKGQPQ